MSISYPVSTPTSIGIANIELSASNAVAVSRSPFTFSQQVHTYPGQMWSATVSIPPVRKDLAEPWVAFLLSLRGQTGTLLLGDPNNTTPQGLIQDGSEWFLAGGSWNEDGEWLDDISWEDTGEDLVFANPVVDGVQASGTSTLALRGFSVSTSNIFRAGDYIQLGAASSATLHKVLVNASSDSNGDLSLEIWPAIRRATIDGEIVTYRDTKGVFRLSSNNQSWSINDTSSYGIQFECMEAI